MKPTFIQQLRPFFLSTRSQILSTVSFIWYKNGPDSQKNSRFSLAVSIILPQEI